MGTSDQLRRLIYNITPPIIRKSSKALYRSVVPKKRLNQIRGEERGPEWYDQHISGSFTKHYSESQYYFLWAVIADRMMHAGIRSILEIGCGTGQFASLLYDKGFEEYIGFDFSGERIDRAKKVCPRFSFIADNALSTDLFYSVNYDCVVCTEFLEHVSHDGKVLMNIRKGAHFYGSVPDFHSASHVRHFTSEQHVTTRYRRYFSEFRVDAMKYKNRTFYLIEGIKT
jgi:SAM-dependent methyltransferase